MKTKKTKVWNILKGLLTALFFVWLLGGVLVAVYSNFHAKKQCIEQDGWIRGVLECHSNPVSDILKGLSWPRSIFASKVSHEAIAKKLTEVEGDEEVAAVVKSFVRPEIGQTYTCLGLAVDGKRPEDVDILLEAVSALKTVETEIASQHLALLLLASKMVEVLKKDNQAESYYSKRCKLYVETMREKWRP